MTFVSAKPSPKLATSIPNIQQLTLAQYRAEVGEKEWKVETDFEASLSP